MLLAVLAAACLSSAIEAAEPASAPARLTPAEPVRFTGVGPVRVGMSWDELRRELPDIELEDKSGEMSCNFARLPGNRWDISWMLIEGRVARTDVDGRGFATEAGARVGDSEARVISLYRGKVIVGPHNYVDKGHYLTVETSDGKWMLVFETDGSRVTSYRIGRTPEAGFIEGCS